MAWKNSKGSFKCLASAHPSAGQCSYLSNEPSDERALCPSFSVTAFQIKINLCLNQELSCSDLLIVLGLILLIVL